MAYGILLVNPPIYDFAAYDFWLKSYGMSTVTGFFEHNSVILHIGDELITFGAKLIGRDAGISLTGAINRDRIASVPLFRRAVDVRQKTNQKSGEAEKNPENDSRQYIGFS